MLNMMPEYVNRRSRRGESSDRNFCVCIEHLTQWLNVSLRNFTFIFRAGGSPFGWALIDQELCFAEISGISFLKSMFRVCHCLLFVKWFFIIVDWIKQVTQDDEIWNIFELSPMGSSYYKMWVVMHYIFFFHGLASCVCLWLLQIHLIWVLLTLIRAWVWEYHIKSLILCMALIIVTNDQCSKFRSKRSPRRWPTVPKRC